MADKEPIAWVTRGGKHIPIFDNGPSDDEKKKEREIAENEKVANSKKNEERINELQKQLETTKGVSCKS